MNLEEFEKKFAYKPDTVDSWRNLTYENPPAGDCDDYAVTVAYLLADKSWFKFWFDVLFFRSVFWWGYASTGSKHLMLWRWGKGWTDNIYKGWSKKNPNKHRFPMILPFAAIKMLIGKFT